ncbi:MAG: hypothetical protein HKO76_08445 [Acidimicrobiia bacterium]|nr:hypothetical protein [Acidimicrobiia bacterium]
MRPIIERLRERKVIQWGAGYLASAWLLYQLLQSLGEPWGILPEHLRTLQMVLGLGLPTALVLAWYHGEKGQQRITRSEAVALLAVLLLTAGAYTAIRPRLEAELSGPPGLETVFDESVVVLPFADLSPLGDQDYLALGIAE